MSFKLYSKANHPITVDLDANNSLHLGPYDAGQIVDDKYRNVRDIVNGIRTRVLGVTPIFAPDTKQDVGEIARESKEEFLPRDEHQGEK